MLPLCVTIAIFSSLIVKMLYGVAYSESARVLAVHVFANIPVALGVTQGLWILNEKKNIIALIRTIVGAVVNFALNLFLIPKYGAVGSAWATLISFFISAVVSNVYFAPNMFKRQIFSLFFLKA
jgi:PST family polysaccharide transporter